MTDTDFDKLITNRIRLSASAQSAPRALRERILADLDSQMTVGPSRFRIRWDLMAAGFAGATLSAAAAVFLWFAGVGNQQDQIRPWLDVAMNQVTRTSMLETAEHAPLRTWLESQVSHTIDVPEIPSAELLGGRLAYVDGIQGAAVEYRVGGTDLTYVMVPMVRMIEQFSNSRDTMLSWTSDGYRIVMWEQDGGTRALISPMPEGELNKIAEHCRRTMT